jgi:hypothetical protein
VALAYRVPGPEIPLIVPILGGADLSLIFPNPGADDDDFPSKLRPCATGDETCMVCAEGTDLGFTLRPSRR